jgi:hypothetical protein
MAFLAASLLLAPITLARRQTAVRFSRPGGTTKSTCNFLSQPHRLRFHRPCCQPTTTCPLVRKQEQEDSLPTRQDAHPPHRRTQQTSAPRAALTLSADPPQLRTPPKRPVDLDSHPILPRKPTSTSSSTKPSSSQRIHLRYMYLTPNANDLRHQPPLELQPFRIPRKPCSPYFSSNG